METKDRILKGAEELFFKYGVKSITMDDIAKHLGISKKTIYQFYADKNEIVQLLIRQHIKINECVCEEMIEKTANVVEEFLGMIKQISAMFSQMNPTLFYDLQKYHPKVWKIVTEFKYNFIERTVEEAMSRGVEQGLVRKDINIKILAKVRVEQIELAFNPQVFPPDKFKLVDVQLALLEHFLYGICTLKGYKLINKYKQVTEEE